MSITLACVVFLLILLIYAMISEVFTVLFRLTGMPEKKARFQVVSLLTNSGYTTAERESVTADDRRRALAQKTMLFGYVFSVSIVSAIVNIVFSLKLAQIEELFWSIPAPAILIAAYFILRRNGKFRLFMSRQIEKMAAAIMARSETNQLLLLDSYGRNIMAQAYLAALPKPLRNVPLKDSGLSAKGVNILLVKRKGEEAIQATGATLLRDGDIVVLFGTAKAIEDAFDLEKGLANGQRG